MSIPYALSARHKGFNRAEIVDANFGEFVTGISLYEFEGSAVDVVDDVGRNIGVPASSITPTPMLINAAGFGPRVPALSEAKT